MVILFLYDPPRGASEGRHENNEHSFFSDLTYLLGIKSFVFNCAGFTCVTFVTGSMAYYATSYYEAGINSKTLALCNTSSQWMGPDYESPIPSDDITFAFGVAVSLGGFFGVILGKVVNFLQSQWRFGLNHIRNGHISVAPVQICVD